MTMAVIGWGYNMKIPDICAGINSGERLQQNSQY